MRIYCIYKINMLPLSSKGWFSWRLICGTCDTFSASRRISNMHCGRTERQRCADAPCIYCSSVSLRSRESCSPDSAPDRPTAVAPVAAAFANVAAAIAVRWLRIVGLVDRGHLGWDASQWGHRTTSISSCEQNIQRSWSDGHTARIEWVPRVHCTRCTRRL